VTQVVEIQTDPLPGCGFCYRKESLLGKAEVGFGTIALASMIFVTACSPTPQTSVSTTARDEWHEFQGTWTAAGNRSTMQLGSDRRVSISNLSGSLLLAGPTRPAVGFRAEAMVLNDSVTGMVGRAVWTDEHGDQAFSELQGEGTATNNKIVGTFVGGTGPYSGATGTYEFSWRFVLETEDGSVQGESIGFKGRVRVGPLPPSSSLEKSSSSESPRP
jgi:hypothetical protein